MRFISEALKLESSLIFTVVQIVTVTGQILISPVLPEVSTRATLFCYSVQTGRYWYHEGVLQTTCNSQSCLPKEKTQHGYTFTADNDKAEVTILSLDRTRDGGLWMCSAGVNQSISLDVYSFPSGLSFTQGGMTEVDLGESQTFLQCQTDGCTYPAPNILWYFKDIVPSAPHTFYKDTGTQKVTGGSCTSPEELYTSSLVLPLYTIWQENIDKNVTLSCGIEYSNVSRNVYSQESKQIRYAVRVTEAVMQQNKQNITDILNVTAGAPVTLTCLTGTSRPPATVVWYLGSQSKGSGAIWNFTPIAADHNGTFYCQVYNTDTNQNIRSDKARLYVRVPIDSVQLRNGTALTLNEGQLAVLVCETSACRPSAAINWMKNGIDIMDSPTGVTEINVGNDLFVSMGMLNYTGQRGDNRKSLTCRAYNGLGSGQTSGSLAVTIYYPPEDPPEIEGRVNGSSFTVIANTSQSLTCRIFGGNPLANLSWICVGHIGISNTSGQTVTSEIVLAVNISVQNQRCTCRTSHPAGRNMDVFVLLQVHYPPFIQLQTSPYSVLENQTLNVTCQVNSNPAADQIFWSPSGDGSVSSSLYFSSVSRNNKGNYSCTAQNTMTPTVGGQQIGMSKRQIEVDVLYPPSIHGLTSPYKVIENQPLNVTCQVSSNPTPDQIIWTPSGEGLVSSRLYFNSVSRNQSGNYSCTARNTMIPTVGGQQNGTSRSEIQVDVLYAAKITEFVVKGNVSEILENSTLELYCRVDSNPYSVISLFFGDDLMSVFRDAHELINTITAGCLNAGKYICRATNSVMNGVTMSAEVNLKVQCGPRLDYRKNILTEYYRALNDNVTLEVHVIAYPEPTDIMWYHRGAKTDIWQQVPDHITSSGGLFSNITIHLGNQGDFGDYLVNMTNHFGIFNLLFHVIPEKVIQTTPGFQVGPLAGGVGSGAVVAAICIILVILFIRRRNMRNKKEEGTPLELNGRSDDINTHESELVDNPMYESSGPRFAPSTSKSTTVAEYAAVVKPPKKDTLAEGSSNLYAQVDKTKKNGKKGDMYQNIDLEGKITNANSKYENSRQTRTETSDENVYENPGAVASNNPLVNKDGLLYADLMLDPPAIKNGKEVIRGIENRTEYAEIAYGKRGEPLPDSVEEKVDGCENKKKIDA